MLHQHWHLDSAIRNYTIAYLFGMFKVLRVTYCVTTRVLRLGHGWPLSPAGNILLSIVILGETLQCILRQQVIQLGHTNYSQWNWRFAPLDVALERSGWCRKDVGGLVGTIIQSVRLHLSTIDRHVPGMQHTECQNFDCCQASQINDLTYRTQHGEDYTGTSCASFGLDVQKVQDILMHGYIPRVMVDTASKILAVQVIASNGDQISTKFVTISHVWSDGLRNPKANTLPLCQLLRLRRYVIEAFKDDAIYTQDDKCLFWIYTLCVPATSDAKAVRTVAINLMAHTCQSSLQTLGSGQMFDVNRCKSFETRMFDAHQIHYVGPKIMDFSGR